MARDLFHDVVRNGESKADKLNQYRQGGLQVLREHTAIKPVYGDVEVFTLFDLEGDRYQVMRSGWLQERRVYGALIHIDLQDGKCWIQYDGTEIGVANELLKRGVPKQDIVLAYHAPQLRQYGDFAVS